MKVATEEEEEEQQQHHVCTSLSLISSPYLAVFFISDLS
jgi:hypothetical protein